MQENEDNDLEATLPASVESMSDAHSDSSSSSETLTSEEELDKTYELAQENEKLKAEVSDLKCKLYENQRSLTVSNNLRVKHKERVAELEEKVETLRNRNDALQDLLANVKKSSGGYMTHSVNLFTSMYYLHIVSLIIVCSYPI